MAIISLQGGMAVGKTTLANQLQNRLKNVYCSFEYQKKKPDNLDMFKELDYYKIQSYFIKLEVDRYRNLPSGNVIIDLGPEEIEFYTLFFPKSIGAPWNVEEALEEELKELRKCNVDGILYLDANTDTLKERKNGDMARKRGSFENYLKFIHPFKKEYFINRGTTTILNVNSLSPKEVEEWVLQWLNRKWDID